MPPKRKVGRPRKSVKVVRKSKKSPRKSKKVVKKSKKSPKRKTTKRGDWQTELKAINDKWKKQHPNKSLIKSNIPKNLLHNDAFIARLYDYYITRGYSDFDKALEKAEF